MITIPEGVSGKWAVEHFEVPEHSIQSLRCAWAGRPVPPGKYTRLRRGSDTIMSDTPAEIRDMSPLIYHVSRLKAETVLINGLGLGVALQKVLEFDHVLSVDVVEISEDVLRLVKPHIDDPRVRWHMRDARGVKWMPGKKWDVVWHDIWDNIPNEDDKPTISLLKRRYGGRCKWQGVWCEHYARR